MSPRPYTGGPADGTSCVSARPRGCEGWFSAAPLLVTGRRPAKNSRIPEPLAMHRLASHGRKPQGFSATASAELGIPRKRQGGCRAALLSDSHPDRCEDGNLFNSLPGCQIDPNIGNSGSLRFCWNQVADHAREGTHGASTAANRGERCSAQLQYLYGREPRQLSRKEARFLHPHRAKPVQRLWLSHKVSLDRAAALCLNSVNGLRFPYI